MDAKDNLSFFSEVLVFSVAKMYFTLVILLRTICVRHV